MSFLPHFFSFQIQNYSGFDIIYECLCKFNYTGHGLKRQNMANDFSSCVLQAWKHHGLTWQAALQHDAMAVFIHSCKKIRRQQKNKDQCEGEMLSLSLSLSLSKPELTHGMCIEFIWLGTRIIFSVKKSEGEKWSVYLCLTEVKSFSPRPAVSPLTTRPSSLPSICSPCEITPSHRLQEQRRPRLNTHWCILGLGLYCTFLHGKKKKKNLTHKKFLFVCETVWSWSPHKCEVRVFVLV